MITNLNLYNFQKHEEEKYQLDKITTIIGDTGSGKSTLVRALRWLALNDWHSCYVRHGAEEVRVAAKVDGIWVKRLRGAENKYVLNGQQFKAVGKAVPEEVSALLKITPQNFQEQFDPTFWFSDSPGDVSRKLNTIVNLDVMDEFLRELASVDRKAQATLNVSRERLTAAKKEVEETEWIDEVSKKFIDIEKKQASLQRRQERNEKLQTLVGKVTQANDKLIKLKNRLPLLDSINAMALRRQTLHESRTELEISLNMFKLAKGRSEVTLPSITGVNTLTKRLNETISKRQTLSQLIENIKELQSCLTSKRTEFNEVSKQLKNCPTCGAPL